MSTSPDCSAVKRCWAVVGTNFTLSASPKIAAATARQVSTSSPVHLPWLSALAKPATPVLTPQMSCPRALTASRSLPACAVPAAPTSAAAATAAAIDLFNILCIPFVIASAAGRSPGVAVPEMAQFLGDQPDARNGAELALVWPIRGGPGFLARTG